MKNSFLNQFQKNIKFNYHSFDRVIIRGYIRSLFFTAGIVRLLRLLGFYKASSGTMRLLTDQLNSHIKKTAEKHNIPIHWWPSLGGGIDGAKLRYVQEKYADKNKSNRDKVYCIITDKEPTRTFAAREFLSKKGNPFTKIYKCRKPVKQYYIYVHDSLLGGPCYLKISSYLPFRCEFYFNGHNAVRVKLDKEGIKYRMKDNSFIDVDDPDKLQKFAENISGKEVLARVNYWKDLFFRFDKGKYSTQSKFLQHEWYMSQVEISSNVIFKSARFATSLFERLLDKFQRLGLPESIAQVFSKRNDRRSISKTFWRLYDNNACIKHWFRRNSIKQYNKTGYYIRTETTINNPKSLGLQKPAVYLSAYLWEGVKINDRFLDCCADVDVSTISEAEHEKFCSPIKNDKGKKITAPDLRKERQLILLKEFLKPKYRAYGFKTADILPNLRDHFRNSSQVRYEMNKLRARGIIEKVKNKSFYVVTPSGWQWIWVEFTAHAHFRNPLISKTYKKELLQEPVQPSKIEEAYETINRGLNAVIQELALCS